jgi:hypothetical protein
MPMWNLDPKVLARSLVEYQPYEAEEVVLDFLDAAAKNDDNDQAAFWIIVQNLIEQMQCQLAQEPDYAPEVRFAAVM